MSQRQHSVWQTVASQEGMRAGHLLLDKQLQPLQQSGRAHATRHVHFLVAVWQVPPECESTCQTVHVSPSGSMAKPCSRNTAGCELPGAPQPAAGETGAARAAPATALPLSSGWRPAARPPPAPPRTAQSPSTAPQAMTLLCCGSPIKAPAMYAVLCWSRRVSGCIRVHCHNGVLFVTALAKAQQMEAVEKQCGCRTAVVCHACEQ